MAQQQQQQQQQAALSADAVRGVQDQQDLTQTWQDIEVLVQSLPAVLSAAHQGPDDPRTAQEVVPDIEKRLEAIQKLCRRACELSTAIQNRRELQNAAQPGQQPQPPVAAAAVQQQQQQQQQHPQLPPVAAAALQQHLLHQQQQQRQLVAAAHLQQQQQRVVLPQLVPHPTQPGLVAPAAHFQALHAAVAAGVAGAAAGAAPAQLQQQQPLVTQQLQEEIRRRLAAGGQVPAHMAPK